MKAADWAREQKVLEELYGNSNKKDFFAQVKKLTAIKKAGVPLAGIRQGDVVLCKQSVVEKEVAKYYSKLYSKEETKEEDPTLKLATRAVKE